ncbi:long-chain fatty acid--CoA ligase [Chachezhania sediminis]|uniref:long-chain fatty acid--CoA ligase n=1 Tax=Chachezhania sediminis TaxID=2599291 RepID=UPI001E49A7A9|nr:long-chain fatty acid--CoA ligase [Chachezhania sediminis]
MSFGKMMDMPLTISSLIEHAARYHGKTEVISVETDGTVTRTGWAEVESNSRKLAAALKRLGCEMGDRCATIAWNNRRHLEIYFGVAGAGMVCHTINPRLFPEQLIYIMNHAADRVLFFDKTFVSAIAQLRPHLETIQHFVYMGAPDPEVAAAIDGVLFYDDLVNAEPDDATWPELDERMPSSLCYTSGTTGNPKGVEYSHRSTVLHTLGANMADGIALSARDTVLPVVPMFHANAWGVPYAAAAVGASMVLPGAHLDGDSLADLIDGQKVTMALGVPTIWLGLLNALKKRGSKAESLQRTLIGGSAAPSFMIRDFNEIYGVELLHGWGMTETSPLGSINQLLAKHADLSQEEKLKLRANQGRPPFGVELRVVDDSGNVLPNDGKTPGNLQIRGHWVVDTYFKAEKSALTADGWFDTGDVAMLDEDGYVFITDRSKDIIKSGGEWISTVELEDIAISHPGVANAAAIAARHEKWDERPVVLAVKAEGANPTEADILDHFKGKIASWQVPDRVIFVDSLPIGGTGKVLKNKLRDEYGDVLIAEHA